LRVALLLCQCPWNREFQIYSSLGMEVHKLKFLKNFITL
jgi:hypothetical protein